MRKVTLSLMFSTLLAGATAVSGCGAQATVEHVNGTPLAVRVTHVTQGWMSQGPVYIGTAQPSQEVQIMAKIFGKVAAVNVSVGSRVKAGDTLFTLDDKDIRDAVAQAQAAVASAQAGVQTAATQQQSAANQASSGAVQAKGGMIQAQTAVNQAQNAVVQAQNGVATAKQALDDATTNKSRYEQLYAQNVIPKAQLEQYETAYVNAQAAYENAQKALQTAQNNLASAQQALQNASSGYETAQNQVNIAQSQAGIQASEQAVKQAQASLQAAEDQLADTVVKSPINGIVGVKNLEVGDIVNPNLPGAPIMDVANLDTIKVLVYLPASVINQVKTGDPVMVKAVALNQYFKGTVKHISPLDDLGKGYPVEVSVPNPDLALKKGMVTEVSLLTPQSKHGILVPTAAIVHENGKTYVYVDDHDIAKRKEIVIDAQEGAQTLVTSGLNDNEQVVASQLSLIKDAQKITAESSQ
ncbi:efflux RND transporter periplasmic adaptor subunit [Fodinisporobacter ferrooxydans]|uniref:Efflux RND transporter periplasmic adaptor subunit n=1 Tax=Fodinisporobacter ferrooxydans TaxID=2901836 RepID=A0ABY4CNZ2_9BACL|nr:efflux RND transporter periplasmic adaptor subunit [Alicyclobacillaceae bacterium MYW30-H2]